MIKVSEAKIDDVVYLFEMVKKVWKYEEIVVYAKITKVNRIKNKIKILTEYNNEKWINPANLYNDFRTPKEVEYGKEQIEKGIKTFKALQEKGL